MRRRLCGDCGQKRWVFQLDTAGVCWRCVEFRTAPPSPPNAATYIFDEACKVWAELAYLLVARAATRPEPTQLPLRFSVS